jgi:hypothetical protein
MRVNLRLRRRTERLPDRVDHVIRTLSIFTVNMPKEHRSRGRFRNWPVAFYLTPNPYGRIGRWGLVVTTYESRKTLYHVRPWTTE